jgi:hypothetical protein
MGWSQTPKRRACRERTASRQERTLGSLQKPDAEIEEGRDYYIRPLADMGLAKHIQAWVPRSFLSR